MLRPKKTRCFILVWLFSQVSGGRELAYRCPDGSVVRKRPAELCPSKFYQPCEGSQDSYVCPGHFSIECYTLTKKVGRNSYLYETTNTCRNCLCPPVDPSSKLCLTSSLGFKDGAVDCRLALDETEDGFQVATAVDARFKKELLRRLDFWRCDLRNDLAEGSCPGSTQPFLYRHRVITSVDEECSLGTELRFWRCHATGDCVRDKFPCFKDGEIHCQEGYRACKGRCLPHGHMKLYMLCPNGTVRKILV